MSKEFNADTNRRRFLAGAAAGTLLAAPRVEGRAGGEVVRIGLIGVGIRGYQLHDAIRQSERAHLVAISDLSDHYIERIRTKLADPTIPVYRDYRKLLEDKSIEAVVIASPDHWHAQMTLDALDAGKDVYVEKPMTYSLAEAIRVRDRGKTKAPIEDCFKATVGMAMAIESYRRQRTARWDPQREQLVC